MLLKRKLCRTVLAAANGQEFVAGFTKRLAEGRDTDLVILDLEMPLMDGITAARVLRSLEGKHSVGKVPILFFSGRKCDDSLKQQMALLAPASYVNKGNESDPEKLVERIDQLVTYLLGKRQTAAPPSAQAAPTPLSSANGAGADGDPP
jgi:CheY-like chemotaxis protein